MSPLYVACKNSHKDVVRLILESSADVTRIFPGVCMCDTQVMWFVNHLFYKCAQLSLKSWWGLICCSNKILSKSVWRYVEQIDVPF